jgi:hypothetical protein
MGGTQFKSTTCLWLTLFLIVWVLSIGFVSFINNKTDEKFGRHLGAMAITLCGDAIVNKLINEFKFSDAEIEKIDLGLSVINMIIATWMVNFFVRDALRAKNIINTMRNFFLKSFEGSNFSSKDIYIRDIIVYEPEFMMLNAFEEKLHGCVFSKNTRTNYHALLQIIYSIRQAEYVNILNKEVVVMIDGPSKHPCKIPMSLLARKFASHLTGNKDNSPQLLVLLSIILFNNVGIFIECCTKYFNN